MRFAFAITRPISLLVLLIGAWCAVGIAEFVAAQ